MKGLVKMINLEEAKQALTIDKSRLDDELILQSSLSYSIGEMYVEAVAVRDTMKEKLATVDAELDALCRMGNEKVTEARVKNMVQVHPNHQEAVIAYNEAKLVADRLGVMKEAIHTRSYMIRELAQLAQINFFEINSVKESTSVHEATYNHRKAQLAEKRVRATG